MIESIKAKIMHHWTEHKWMTVALIVKSDFTRKRLSEKVWGKTAIIQKKKNALIY